MVRKSDINRLFKQKHFTGHQVGRLLLETLLDQLYHQPQRISDEEIAQMRDNLANEYEGSIYDTYVNIYASLVDIYNFIQSYGTSAELNLVALKSDVALISRTALDHQSKLYEPVTITERQYRRYETKYRKYLKSVSDQHKKSAVAVMHYLQERFEIITDQSKWEETDETTFWKKYPHVKQALDQYKSDGTCIPLKWDKFLRKVNQQLNQPDHLASTNLKSYAFDETIRTHEHDKELQDQIDSKHLNITLKDLKTSLLTAYLSERYEKGLSKNDASEQAFIDNGVYLKYLINIKESTDAIKEENKLPSPLTKYDVIRYYFFDIPSIYMDDDSGQSTNQDISTADIQKLDQFLAEDFFDLYQALSKDISTLHPKMQDILAFKDQQELLHKKTTEGDLAKAGDDFCKEDTSITSLRSNDDYGIWNVFPKKHQHQAKMHGFSVYHDPANELEEDHFTKLAEKEDSDFYQHIKEYTSDQQTSKRYNAIHEFIALYQAYEEFIDALIVFSNDPDLGEFKKAPAYKSFLIELNNFHALRNLTLYELEQTIHDQKLLKQTQDRIISTFELIDTDTEYITPRKVEDVASYIARIFSQEDGTPISTAKLLNDIAGGKIDAKKE